MDAANRMAGNNARPAATVPAIEVPAQDAYYVYQNRTISQSLPDFCLNKETRVYGAPPRENKALAYYCCQPLAVIATLPFFIIGTIFCPIYSLITSIPLYVIDLIDGIKNMYNEMCQLINRLNENSQNHTVCKKVVNAALIILTGIALTLRIIVVGAICTPIRFFVFMPIRSLIMGGFLFCAYMWNGHPVLSKHSSVNFGIPEINIESCQRMMISRESIFYEEQMMIDSHLNLDRINQNQ